MYPFRDRGSVVTTHRTGIVTARAQCLQTLVHLRAGRLCNRPGFSQLSRFGGEPGTFEP